MNTNGYSAGGGGDINLQSAIIKDEMNIQISGDLATGMNIITPNRGTGDEIPTPGQDSNSDTPDFNKNGNMESQLPITEQNVEDMSSYYPRGNVDAQLLIPEENVSEEMPDFICGIVISSIMMLCMPWLAIISIVLLCKLRKLYKQGHRQEAMKKYHEYWPRLLGAGVVFIFGTVVLGVVRWYIYQYQQKKQQEMICFKGPLIVGTTCRPA